MRSGVKGVATLGRSRTIAQVPLPAILKALWVYWPYQLLSSPLWASQAHGAYLVCFIFGTQLCPANSRCTTSCLQWLTPETIGLCFSTLLLSLIPWMIRNWQWFQCFPPYLHLNQWWEVLFDWQLSFQADGSGDSAFFIIIISILFFFLSLLACVRVFEDGMCGSPSSLVTSLHLISLTFCANPPWMSLAPSPTPVSHSGFPLHQQKANCSAQPVA